MFSYEKMYVNQEELKVVPRGKGLVKRYKFSQELEVVTKRKGLTKKS
jgi:hypothetical protein